MHYALFSLFVCVAASTGLAQEPAAPEVSATDLLGLANRSGAPAAAYTRYLDEASRLLPLGREAAAQQLADARRALDAATRLSAPSPRWFILMSRYHAASGRPALAEQLLEEGRAAYPYSNRLRVAEGMRRMDAGELATREQVLALDMPEGARYELAAELALRAGDFVRACLDVERAYYLGDGQVDQARVGACAALVLAAALESGSCQAPRLPEYPAGSLSAAYAGSLCAVLAQYPAGTSRTLDTLSTTSPNAMVRLYADIRTYTLRHFAAQGHLGRFDDPVLTDLYVLDQAGYLTWATQAMLHAGSYAEYEAFCARDPLLARSAQAYIAGPWADDVDARLRRARDAE